MNARSLGEQQNEDDVNRDARHAADLVDRRLLSAIANDRDEVAMETLYRHYQDRLVPFLYRLTHDRALIEETYNEVMLKVWRKAHQYKGQSMVSSWIFSIGYRTCLRMIKKAQRGEFASSDSLAFDAAHEGDNPLRERMVHQALGQLSPDHRMVLELAYFQGLATQEIAQIVGRPVNTVKTRLHHARNKMRDILGDAHGL